MEHKIDLNILEQILVKAGDNLILPNFTKADRNYKDDGSIVTEADIRVQEFIQDQLMKVYPEIKFLGEEMPESEQRAMFIGKDSFWCLDPIDGTSNFAAGLPFFSTSLALISDGKVVAAIVYDPVRRECFSSTDDAPAVLNGQSMSKHAEDIDLSKALAMVDFKRLVPKLRARLVKDLPFASQRSLGSVALEWCWLAAGRFHVYLHGRQKAWDYAAGAFIFSKTAGEACTLQGEDILNPNWVAKSAVAAKNPELFKKWCDYLQVPTS